MQSPANSYCQHRKTKPYAVPRNSCGHPKILSSECRVTYLHCGGRAWIGERTDCLSPWVLILQRLGTVDPWRLRSPLSRLCLRVSSKRQPARLSLACPTPSCITLPDSSGRNPVKRSQARPQLESRRTIIWVVFINHGRSQAKMCSPLPGLVSSLCPPSGIAITKRGQPPLR